MRRFGAAPDKACEIDLDHIFISRLKLLIVMMLAGLEGYPLGAFRRSAMVGNARFIAADTLDLERKLADCGEIPVKDGTGFDRRFYRRVKLLAAMAQTVTAETPLGEHRRKALRENLEQIGDALSFNIGIKKVEYLRVA